VASSTSTFSSIHRIASTDTPVTRVGGEVAYSLFSFRFDVVILALAELDLFGIDLLDTLLGSASLDASCRANIQTASERIVAALT